MYIAIVADNIAIRKHMERLLDRASDALMKETGNLYIESYGDPESIWSQVKRYDLFFVDIQSNESLASSVIQKLYDLGFASQVIICQPEGRQFSFEPAKQGFLSIQHPIQIQILHQLILDAYKASLTNQIHTIEVRGQKTTEYIEIDSIIYAESMEHIIYIYLTEDRCIEMMGEMRDFERSVKGYDFTYLTKDIMCHKLHIIKKKGHTITLSNGKTLKTPLLKRL